MSSQKRKKSTFLIGVLYFMQGLSNALPFTLVYTYAIVPSYYVLSLLEVAKFAYATKWLICKIFLMKLLSFKFITFLIMEEERRGL